MDSDVARYLSELNSKINKIRKGCTAHINKNGRLYYMNHETKTSSWLPPVESWDSGGIGLPYGWEAAFDRDGKTYFINHVNRTTTCEDPRKESDDEPPQPRDVELVRDPQKGFGFVAGSEKPVIVRFVTEAGPSEGKLLPGDQILQINGEDVMKSPRERVIELVRSCKHSVKLQVCQPYTNNTTRKSALLTAAKKAKLKSNPSRVRFAEGVVINGSPLYCPSPYDSTVPFMPNVLKVFLENGQTKSFKYDSTTTVQDVLDVLQEKLSLTSMEHFSLVVEHIRSIRRNKLSILNPKDTLAKIAARPGAHNLRCLFRITYVPKDIYEFMQRDPIAFDYLFVQSCNDVVQERFAPELKYDVALRLAALHLQQHALTSGIQGKMIVKTIEREYGLEKFVPASLLETMKRKELLKLLNQLMKQNQALSGPGQKQLTLIQTKFHYLKIVSDLPSYGAKSFATCAKNSAMESAILVGPRIGISQISTIRNIAPMNLAQFGELESVDVTREEEDDSSYKIKIRLRHPEKECLNFCMEERETDEFILVLEQYFRQLVGEELPVEWEGRNPEPTEIVPAFHGRHTVQEAPWSYCPPALTSSDLQSTTMPRVRTIDLSIPPPPYIPCEERQLSRSNSRDQFSIATSPTSVDYNMNEMEALVAALSSKFNKSGISFENCKSTKEDDGSYLGGPSSGHQVLDTDLSSDVGMTLKDFADKPDCIAAQLQRQSDVSSGIDMHSVMSMEMLEEETDVDGNVDDKSHDVINRITEMSRIVNDAENYLMNDGSKASDLGTKCQDSLLFIQRNSSESFGEPLTPNSDLMPSESEAESTPTNSPTHHAPVSVTDSPRTLARKMCSSFGLHSPHLLASLDQQTDDVEELLRQLQASTDLPLEEASLCLDPDIIDLTIVPPPSATDVDFSLVTPDGADLSSKSFMSAFSQHSEDHDMITTLTNSSIAVTCEQYYSSHPGILFSNSSCCDSFAASSSSSSSAPSSTSGYESGGISGCETGQAEEDDDISAYIIPPPPISSSVVVEEQNRILARFRQAAEEVRRMMSQGHDGAVCEKYADSMNSVSKFCTIPRRHEESHRPSLSSLASLVTPIRETKSISTGSSSSFGSSNDGGQPDTCDNNGLQEAESVDKDSLLNGINGDTGEPHPQPPPRTKRINSGQSENSETLLDGRKRTVEFSTGVNGDIHRANGHAESCNEKERVPGSYSLDSFKDAFGGNQQPSQRIARPGENSLPLSIDHSLALTNHSHPPTYPLVNGHYNGHEPIELINPSNGGVLTNGYESQTLVNGNGLYEASEEPSSLPDDFVKGCPTCSETKNGFTNECVCGKLSRFRSYHQSLPRKAIHAGLRAFPIAVTNGDKMESNFSDDTAINGTGVFRDARQEITELVINLDSVCQSRIKECSEGHVTEADPVKLAKVRETLMSESRQFVTASKLFVKSITESSGKMEENLMTCLMLLDRIFAVSELVVMEMSKPSQINVLVEKLKEMALAYSRTVSAAHSAASGAIPNPNMAGLMHQATSLATSLTTLMRTLRTFHTP